MSKVYPYNYKKGKCRVLDHDDTLCTIELESGDTIVCNVEDLDTREEFDKVVKGEEE